MAETRKLEMAEEKKYRDVSPLGSDSESDVDNDPLVRQAHDSIEVARNDHRLLDEEEEREELLAKNGNANQTRGLFSQKTENGIKKIPRKEKRRSKRRKSKRKGDMDDEEGELMFEMEEGGPKSDVSSQASSSSAELDKLGAQKRPKSKISKKRKHLICAFLALGILALFILLTIGAYKVSKDHDTRPHLKTFSNGTSKFAPTTILISLDGFRADFLERGITPTLNQFISEGISPKYMLPSFPSLTFPNHYTLVTGLYPESHGVVGNTFWDPELQKEFYYTDPERSMQPYWWSQGEPLWSTAEKQEVRAAVHMWPGSEAGMEYEATYLDKFNGSEVLSRKTDRIMELLDMAESVDDIESRPQLIAAYVPNVDSDGHKYGPNSTEVWDAIQDVDTMLHHIFRGLDERNLTEIVNVVVVSDHGMATTSIDRMVQLDDLVDLELIDHIDGWPHHGLRPRDPIDIQGLYDRLSVEAERSEGFDVYLRDGNMPDRYHFANNDRIAPLWVMPRAGWVVVEKKDFDMEEAKANGEEYDLRGVHGYDHEHPLMRAIFVARGPAFPHKPNSRVENFQNIEVYNIVCDSLGIEPKLNNGTLRLPLKPVGLHSDVPQTETPVDPPSSTKSPIAEQGSADEQIPPQESSPPKETGASDEEESKEEGKPQNFWAYMKAKLKAAVEWAHKVIAGLKNSSKPDPAQEEGG